MSGICQKSEKEITAEIDGILARVADLGSAYHRNRLGSLAKDILGDLQGYRSITDDQWDLLQKLKGDLSKWGK
jgi:hypothetical protein